MIRVLTGCLLAILSLSCQPNQEEKFNTDEFILQDGFQIEIVATEPLLDSPVAMAFDNQGRIWVVELPGYMRDIDGSDENIPDGRIVILEDKDQDGQMDDRHVFLDNLIAPRALALVYNGLLYTESTNLWWASIEKDQAGEKVLVDSLYVIGGNIEHQPNGLLYHLDNWIYSAKSNARYRRINGKWLKEVTTSRGQWGITNDDKGRLFYNDNSNPLMGDYLPPNHLIANPFYKPKYGVKQQISKDRRVFPLQPTAVNRGYQEGVLDENQKLRFFTSACGPLIFRGNQLGTSFYGNAFVCGPEVNLVKRYVLKADQGRVVAQPAYDDIEFLLSKDETFRPVNLYNGHDGALYVLDMRKGIIQHRAYMTSYLREQILGKGLDSISGKGRIYRVVAAQNERTSPLLLSGKSASELVELLQHPNASIREKAQQALIFDIHREVVQELEHLALDTDYPLGQIHALWTMEGLNLLSFEHLSQVIIKSDDPGVINQALLLLKTVQIQDEKLFDILEKARAVHSPETDLILSHFLGGLDQKKWKHLWLALAENYQNDPLYCEALVSGISGKEQYYLDLLPKKEGKDTLCSFIKSSIKNKEQGAYQTPRFATKTYKDDRTRGAILYNQYCASCHSVDGTGIEFLAPPLVDSEYLTGSSKNLVLLLLHGLEGPVTVNGKRYEMNLVMPGLKDNPAFGDDEIRDLLVFIQNAFASTPTDVEIEDIREIRENTKAREKMYTEEELLNIEY